MQFQFDYCSAYPDTLQTGDQAREYFAEGATTDFQAWKGVADLFSTFYSANLEYLYNNLDIFQCVIDRSGKHFALYFVLIQFAIKLGNCVTGGLCPTVHQEWTVGLWKENYQNALGLSSWDEVLSSVDDADVVYDNDVLKCIQERSSNSGNGCRIHDTSLDLHYMFQRHQIYG